MSDIWGKQQFQEVHYDFNIGGFYQYFFQTITLYDLHYSNSIIHHSCGLSIRGKACRIERDYTRTSANITSVRRVSKRTHINYEYRDQSGVLHNGFLSVRGLTNYNSMSSIAIYYNPENPSASYTEKTMNSDKNAPFIYGGAVLLGTLVFLWRRR